MNRKNTNQAKLGFLLEGIWREKFMRLLYERYGYASQGLKEVFFFDLKIKSIYLKKKKN